MRQGLLLGYHQLCLSAGQGCEDQVCREIKPIKQPMMINNPIKNPLIVYVSVRPGYKDQAHRDKAPKKTANRKIPNGVLLANKKHQMKIIH